MHCLHQTGAQCCGLLGQTGRGPSQLDLAKAARDKKKADMSKRQQSSKETKAYTATVDDDVFYLFLQKQKIPSDKALAAAAAES